LERLAVLWNQATSEATAKEGISMSKQQPPSRSTVRCAVYTRKSSEEGLEQEFNSLDAQRESAENYIRSQASEGWACLPDRSNDCGFAIVETRLSGE
jgi:hypothetical protein